MGDSRFSSIAVKLGESDLWIGWGNGSGPRGGDAMPSGRSETVSGRTVEPIAIRALAEARNAIATYGALHPEFLASLEPIDEDDSAPAPVDAMLRAARAAKVGPMAAVAGAIAEAVGRAVREAFGFQEIVVENGGDLWIDVDSPLTVAVYAGLSSLSRKFGVVVGSELCPCGLACSSGTVGPSLSFGKADAAVVLSRDAAAADAWATALGNRLRAAADLEPAVRALVSPSDANYPYEEIDEKLRPRGALAVMADRLAAAGTIRLAPIKNPGTS